MGRRSCSPTLTSSWGGLVLAFENPEYLAAHVEVLRDCYRRAAADSEAMAVVIG